MRNPARRRVQRFVLAVSLLLLSLAPLGAGVALLGGRFAVRAEWSIPGMAGEGTAVQLTDQSVYVWFFDPANPELFVKIVDACVAPFDRYWVYAAGLTDVAVTLEVVDLLGDGAPGTTWTRSNPLGTPFPPIYDTQAFATCGLAPACGLGAPADVAASPRADVEAEELALFLTDLPVARSADYTRVAADLAAIRAARPELEARFEPAFVTGDLLVGFDVTTTAEVVAGTYSGWSCLNDWYGFESATALIPQHFLLRVGGRYRMDQVRAEYAALPGVTSAEPNHAGYFPGIEPPLICGDSLGETFVYYFRESDRTILRFESTPETAPSLTGTAAPGDDPAWLPDALDCLNSDTPLDL